MIKSKLCGPSAVVTMTEAQFQRNFGTRDGFSENRNWQKLGSIPPEDYALMQQLADQRGEELTGADLEAYLKSNPQYMTVRGIDTGRTGQIIVK